MHDKRDMHPEHQKQEEHEAMGHEMHAGISVKPEEKMAGRARQDIPC